MATSGTYTFSVTRDTIINKALRLLQVYGIGDTPDPLIVANAAEALNIWVKGLVVQGLPLWCVQEIAIPMVAGQSVYNLGIAVGASNTLRPIRILHAFIRNATGQDVELMVESRYDYNSLGNKSSSGQPNQLFYDPQVDTGKVTVYNVPSDALSTLRLTIQRQFQDFVASGDTPDFPQEAYQMLAWGLADEISLEFETNPTVLAAVASRAKTHMDNFMNFMQEYASVYFTPSEKGQQS